MAFDKSKFIDQFKAETREHIQKLNEGLLKLEKDVKDKALLESLMREAHTIKGSAMMMGYKRISDIAHKMESGLEKAMNFQIEVKKSHFDLLFKCFDVIESLLEDKLTWEEKGISGNYVEELCEELEGLFSAQTPSQKEKKEKKASEPSEPLKKESKAVALDSLLTPEKSIRVDIENLNKLMNSSGELVIAKIRLKELITSLSLKAEADEVIGQRLVDLIKELNLVNENIDFQVTNMQNEVIKVRMVPIFYLFNIFPRAMRDLAFKNGKDVELEIKGEDTHLDRGVIDEMKDPLMHILRNAIDHGIELPIEREKKHKQKAGKIILSAYQKGSQVVIEVSDDGKGIDIARVKEQAIKQGLITKEKAADLAEEQIFQLLFISGFSTKEDVSEVSGRGVGLDVVREKVAKLKGIIEISSKPDLGTKFTIKLPLTLVISESLLVSSGPDTFAIPIEAVIETTRITQADIRTIETKEAITIRNHIMPLVRLSDIFELPKKGITERKTFSVVIVQSAEKKIGLLVDELFGRQEIIRKNLGYPLEKIKDIAGATILGNGKVMLILDIPSIIESAEGVVIKRPKIEAHLPEKKKRRTILLAEDVLSTAMLEKNVLESVGYSVVIARDGQEALERAAQEKFDLIITDVLMPRVDGFELTARLKKDKLHKDVPVIIVTTRESDADKRRGMEAGAQAYILKSEFTSEGLLETIERLIG